MAEALKNYDDMLPEFKWVDVFYKAVLTLIIRFISFSQFVENFYLDIGIIHVKLFIFAKFCCHNSLIRVFVVETLDDLAERPLVDNSDNLVPICNLLTNFGQILPIFIGNWVLVMPSHLADCKNSRVHLQFHLFKFCQFLAKKLQSFFGCIPIKIRRFHGALIDIRAASALISGPTVICTLPLGLWWDIVCDLPVRIWFSFLVLIILLRVFTILLLLGVLITGEHLGIIAASELWFPVEFICRCSSVWHIFKDIWLFTLLSKLAYWSLVSMLMGRYYVTCQNIFYLTA